MHVAETVPHPTALPEPGRPTRPLPLLHLLNLSVYWLGINAIWAGLGDVVLQKRVEQLLGEDFAGRGLALLSIGGMAIAVLVQPTVGAISDYTVTRWGRRKPYIAIGATLDVVFLIGIGLADTFLALAAFLALLQFSSNFAQGPFQGYVPDLVPAKQVGVASGLMGVMIVIGQIVGAGVGAIGLATGNFVWPMVALGVIQFGTALVLLFAVDEGRAGLPREGRTWWSIAGSPWSREVLRERSFVWLVASRLLFLAAPTIVIGFALYYLQRSLGLDDDQAAAALFTLATLVGITTALTTFPAAKLSDRFGRKPLIYVASAIGVAGIIGLAAAPNVFVAFLFLVPVAVSAGSFLAVDWALMTDIIPKASAGRFMGISNVATALAGPLGLTLGGVVLDGVGRSDFAAGPRAAFLVGVAFYVLGALLLRPVDPRRREE